MVYDIIEGSSTQITKWNEYKYFGKDKIYIMGYGLSCKDAINGAYG